MVRLRAGSHDTVEVDLEEPGSSVGGTGLAVVASVAAVVDVGDAAAACREAVRTAGWAKEHRLKLTLG